MFVLIVGCGRVGSTRRPLDAVKGAFGFLPGRDPESHARLEVGLDTSWEEAGGQFTVGTALETQALEGAGIIEADAFVAATNGDNTNIVIAQIAQKRYEVETVIARILDPLRASGTASRGCGRSAPTKVAVEMLEDKLLSAANPTSLDAGSAEFADSPPAPPAGPATGGDE